MLKFISPVVAAALLLGACNQRRRRRSAPPPQRAWPPAPCRRQRSTSPPGRATLSPQSTATIRQVAAEYRSPGNATVTLTGHADTVGSPDYNVALSQRRTDAVSGALVSAGVPGGAPSPPAPRAKPVCRSRPPTTWPSSATAVSTSPSSAKCRWLAPADRRRLLRGIQRHVSATSYLAG